MIKTLLTSIISCLFFIFASCATAPVAGPGSGTTGPVFLSSGIFVMTNGNDASDGLSPSTAVKTIQTAIQKAVLSNLNNIYIQSGVYTPGNGLNASDYGIVVGNGTNNISLLGGCDSGFTMSRNGYSELDGLFSLSNIIRVSDANNLIFDRLVVRGGKVMGLGSPNNRGGGIYLYNVSDCRITNCVISNNVAFDYGGGICIYLGERCTISAAVVGNFCTNSAGFTTFGGGIALKNASSCRVLGVVSKNLVGTYDAYCYGGGVYVGSGQSNTINAYICSNQSLSWGGSAGGIYIDHDYYAVITGEISWNYAYSNNSFGGGIFVSVGIGTLISNAVIVGNYCRTRGGAIYLDECTNTKLLNCVMTNNESDFYGVLDVYHSAPQFCGLMVSNCWIGAASNSTGIGEMLSGMGAIDLTNHVMVDNKFLTNKLGQLYYDFYNTYVNIDQIFNVNSTAFTGAAITTGNVATNL
jgi:predicted outer membrane repeat protein